jgi:ssDNA-binding Zn-finger/Zn-ribbon topoisomerase 1
MAETPVDEKRCPKCNGKLLTHIESPRRRIVYCSNPSCSYKSEEY